MTALKQWGTCFFPPVCSLLFTRYIQYYMKKSFYEKSIYIKKIDNTIIFIPY